MLLDFGPNHFVVGALIARAAMLLHQEALELFEARVAWFETRTEGYGERDALRSAAHVATRVGRLSAYEAARREAAAAFRTARRGEVGPWLSVAAAVSNAAGALVVADLLDRRDYYLLVGPWRQAIGQTDLVPVGPGLEAPSTTERRRRLAVR
jgi:hypothetical protein